MGRDKRPGPQQPQVSAEEEARAREKTHKLRRNCKDPAVAKRGLTGEGGSGSGGARGSQERRETV